MPGEPGRNNDTPPSPRLQPHSVGNSITLAANSIDCRTSKSDPGWQASRKHLLRRHSSHGNFPHTNGPTCFARTFYRMPRKRRRRRGEAEQSLLSTKAEALEQGSKTRAFLGPLLSEACWLLLTLEAQQRVICSPLGSSSLPEYQTIWI